MSSPEEKDESERENRPDQTRPASTEKTASFIVGAPRDTTVDQLFRRVKTIETKIKGDPSVQQWQDYSAPLAPTILRYGLEAVCDCFSFTFAVQRQARVMGYNLYRSTVNSSDTAERVDYISQPSDPAVGYITWKETTKGTVYYYWVTSVNFGGTESAKVLVRKETYYGGVVALTDAATIAIDATLGLKFSVTLGGNRTLGNPTGAINGQQFLIFVIQDGTGGRSLTYDTKYDFGDMSMPALNTGAKKGSILSFAYWAATDKFWYTGYGTGYLGAL